MRLIKSGSTALRFVAAILPAFIAIAVQLVLWPFVAPSVWFLFYPAVFVSSWLGGLRAAVASAVLCVGGALWWFVPPYRSLDIDEPRKLVPAAIFFGTAMLFGLFHGRLRRANRRTADALATSEAANAELKKSNQERHLFSCLIENSSDFIGIADPSGKPVYVNPAGRRMVGLTPDRPVETTAIPEYYAESERAFAENVIVRAMVEKGHWAGETYFRNWQTGAPIPVSDTHFMIRDPATGETIGMGTVTRDISDVKRARDELERARHELEQANQALQAAHADLARAQSVAKIGSWRLDVRRNELVWTDENYRIFGVPLGTPMTYDAFLDCVHPADRAFVDRKWNEALRGEPYDIEHRLLVHGTVKWVREKADLEFDDHGALVGGIGITQDITERQQHEQQLRDAQERLDLALRGADLGTWDWNVQTGEVVFNARWAEMRGYRLDEIRGHVDTWIAGVHPDDWSRAAQALEDYFQGRTPEYDCEHRVRTKSGDWIWILDRGRVFARDEHGQPLRMVGTELDITARKRAEEELRLAEAKSSGIVSISADAIITIDEQQHITLFNEGAEKIFGYSKEEAIGLPLERLVPERFRDIHRRAVERFAAGGEVARHMGTNTFGLRKNGEEFPADATISKLEVAGTKLLTVSLRDISEQKRIEREQRLLAEVGALFASTLDYDETVNTIARLAVRDLCDFCIIDLVLEGEVQRRTLESRDPGAAALCEAFRKLPLDRSRPHLVKETIDTHRTVLIERLSPEELPSFAQSEEHLRVLRAVDPRSLIVAPLLVHGEFLGVFALISSKESRLYGATDVRLAEELALRAALAIENARLYRLATHAVQAREDVLGIVAHDLRNPLGTILLEAELLRRSGGAPERPAARDPAAVIERSARRMNRLIQDLLDVTRIEAGRLSVEQRGIPAAQIVLDSLESQKHAAASASVELHCDMPPALPRVWGDRDRLLQVFENLIGNALKFTSAGGHITIGAAPREGEVLFWVADTGAGIAADDLPHVFDEFWQAAHAKRAGAGLGLPIVKGIVEAHGGRVWVESTLGRGSIFFFTIPVAPQAELRRSEPRR